VAEAAGLELFARVDVGLAVTPLTAAAT